MPRCIARCLSVTLSSRTLSDPVIIHHSNLFQSCLSKVMVINHYHSSAKCMLGNCQLCYAGLISACLSREAFCLSCICFDCWWWKHMTSVSLSKMTLNSVNSAKSTVAWRHVLWRLLTACPHVLSFLTPLTDFVSLQSLCGTPVIVAIDWPYWRRLWGRGSIQLYSSALQKPAKSISVDFISLTC